MQRIGGDLSNLNALLITPRTFTLIGTSLRKSNLVKQMTVNKKQTQPQVQDGDILLIYTCLLCLKRLSLALYTSSTKRQ